MEEKYDSALLAILQCEGKIQPFLDIVFGFLLRRTDFYKTLDDECGKLGFPAGVAEKVTFNAFKKYQNLAKKNEEVVHRARAVVAAEQKSADDIVVDDTVENLEEVVETVAPIDHDNIENRLTEESTERKKNVAAEADSYNGADRDAYMWSQSSTDVDVRIKIPKDVVKGKHVKIDLSHDCIAASRWCSETSTWRMLFDGQFIFRINLEKSVWTLVPGEYIHVCLEKNDDRWWDALLADEPKIDVRKLDAHRFLEELPDDEQSKVEELMYDQQQKLLGKPTIQQMKIQNVLKEAWDKDGSPFKGQPFDLSIVNVGGSESASGDHEQLIKNLTSPNIP